MHALSAAEPGSSALTALPTLGLFNRVNDYASAALGRNALSARRFRLFASTTRELSGLGIGPQDPWTLPPPALLPGERSSSAQLTPTKHGLHRRRRSRSDARRVPSCRYQLNFYAIARQASWSAPRIGALYTRRSCTPHSKGFAEFLSGMFRPCAGGWAELKRSVSSQCTKDFARRSENGSRDFMCGVPFAPGTAQCCQQPRGPPAPESRLPAPAWSECPNRQPSYECRDGGQLPSGGVPERE